MEEGLYVCCYTLHLYCRCYTDIYGSGCGEYAGASQAACNKAARADGWTIKKLDGRYHVRCPKCKRKPR